MLNGDIYTTWCYIVASIYMVAPAEKHLRMTDYKNLMFFFIYENMKITSHLSYTLVTDCINQVS